MTRRIFVIILVIVVCIIGGYWAYRRSLYVYPLPETAKNVDLQKYSGDWHEIALIPNWFEKGCSCTKANYRNKNGYILVMNNCYQAKKKSHKFIKGKAWSVNKDNSKLKVQFMWPFRGDYWILYVDQDYQYALVGGPTRKYLWVLARTTKIPAKIYSQLVAIAKKQGFDVSKLIMTKTPC